jgi:hypothetical protein
MEAGSSGEPVERLGARSRGPVHDSKMDAAHAVEVDFRSQDGVNVFLLWHPTADGMSIFVYDENLGESFGFAVGAVLARDAFRDPYTYYTRATGSLPLQ